MGNMSLFDFIPEKIAERKTQDEEAATIMDLLDRFSAEMLMERLRNEGGHPKPEWGDEKTWRFYYLKECKRRGLRLLEQLGWPTEEDSLYVNIYTGSVKTLIGIATTMGGFSERCTIANQVQTVIEHWEPNDKIKPNAAYKIEYLENEC